MLCLLRIAAWTLNRFRPRALRRGICRITLFFQRTREFEMSFSILRIEGDCVAKLNHRIVNPATCQQ